VFQIMGEIDTHISIIKMNKNYLKRGKLYSNTLHVRTYSFFPNVIFIIFSPSKPNASNFRLGLESRR